MKSIWKEIIPNETDQIGIRSGFSGVYYDNKIYTFGGNKYI